MDIRERLKELETWPAETLASRVVILECSRDHWYQAAKKALAGDNRELRRRVKGHENPLWAARIALQDDPDV